MSTVLVTGGTGFVASHCLLRLLQDGYNVKTTVRSLKKEQNVRSMMEKAGISDLSRLSFVVADLNNDEGWSEAVKDCQYVLHVASPVPIEQPKDANELIKPARDGTLRVLRAAKAAGVKRVVYTSSVVAVGYGHGHQDKPFTEKDWTNTEGPNVSAYGKSKTLAERAAWDYIEKEGGDLELSVVNPAGIYGPVLGPHYSSSLVLVKLMLEGQLFVVPKLYLAVVDVRDLTDLILRAMLDPKAKGERFLATDGETLSMYQCARALQDRLGDRFKNVARIVIPDWVMYTVSHFSSTLDGVLTELDLRLYSNDKARTVLGWKPHSSADALVATAESLMKQESEQ
ncbi:DEKNAAC102091 [Brettanomyces naardenensis]|uniref:DEKNAAC102091 n=1 Tax=Brettanomyces naardenensis TaxID=13370 RepID=A0A448YJU5_BRENA|nr:DEKNAAC102091 [Brettanomyces naardenensis]